MGEYGSETKFPIFFVSKESLGSQTQEEGGVQDIYKNLFVKCTSVYKCKDCQILPNCKIRIHPWFMLGWP